MKMKKIFLSIVIIMCTCILAGCNYKKDEKDKYEQLSEYLINNGWEKSEYSQYEFTIKPIDILDKDGKPINIDWYNLDIKKMNIQRTTRFSGLSVTTTSYSLKSNIATGNEIILNSENEWEKYVSFSYDFNSGNLTIDDKIFSGSCTDASVNLKEKLENIIVDTGLKIEEFK